MANRIFFSRQNLQPGYRTSMPIHRQMTNTCPTHGSYAPDISLL